MRETASFALPPVAARARSGRRDVARRRRARRAACASPRSTTPTRAPSGGGDRSVDLRSRSPGPSAASARCRRPAAPAARWSRFSTCRCSPATRCPGRRMSAAFAEPVAGQRADLPQRREFELRARYRASRAPATMGELHVRFLRRPALAAGTRATSSMSTLYDGTLASRRRHRRARRRQRARDRERRRRMGDRAVPRRRTRRRRASGSSPCCCAGRRAAKAPCAIRSPRARAWSCSTSAAAARSHAGQARARRSSIAGARWARTSPIRPIRAPQLPFEGIGLRPL